MTKKRIEADVDEASTGLRPQNDNGIPPEIDEGLDPEDLSSMFPGLPKSGDAGDNN